jgi:hypothetical protein
VRHHSDLVTITSAEMMPGTHPHRVRRKTSKTEPQPLSKTARGGNRMATSTLSRDILQFTRRFASGKIL